MINSKPAPLRFPQDTLRFLYWVFFKPIALHYSLCEIDDALRSSNVLSFFMLWRKRKEHPEYSSVIQLVLLNIFVFQFLDFPLLFLLNIVGIKVNWLTTIISVILSMTLGSFTGGFISGLMGWLLKDMTNIVVGGAVFIIAGVLAGSLAVGTIFLVFLGTTSDVIKPIIFGSAFGVMFGLASGMATPNRVGVAFGIVFGLIGGPVLTIGAYVTDGISAGLLASFIFDFMFILSYFRLFFYPFEAIWSLIQVSWFPNIKLDASPIVWDEIIWLPLPGLKSLLVQIGKQDRYKGMEAITNVVASYRQGWAAKRALLELTVYDVRQAKSLETISDISNNLSWLPDDARMDMQELLLGVEQASQHARAALESETLYNRQEQLRMGLQVIDRIRSGLAYAEKSDITRQMIPALEGWKRVFGEHLADASLKENIPNVYVSGSPLIKDSKTFKGRRDLFRSLGNELISPAGQRPTLLLFGARRMGKTSTLKQLPVQLGPQIVPVSIDLQKASTVESASALLSLVSNEIVKSANLERRLKLPQIEKEALEKDPYLVFQEWLASLDEKFSDYYWVLLALDEFESLGEMLEDKRVDERIFQLLRGIIQHNPRITVLMSGAHTLEELPPLWSNYFINTKMLKVGPLENTDAVELITRPIKDFPLVYDDDALELMLAETGCHPNWLQFTCREVVERLNEEDRFHAAREDVEWAIGRVPQALAGDFKDMWEGRDSSDLMRKILKAVSKEESISVTKLEKLKKDAAEFQKTMDFILRRDILIFEEDTYRFRSGLLRRWVSKQP